MKYKELKILCEEAEQILDNKIKGGLADNKTLSDIAYKHGVPLKLINQQYRMGIQIEREHTSDKEEASEIAMDHLWEDPKYYTKLKSMESE